MKRYAVEVELKIHGKITVEDQSERDAMRYVESRNAEYLYRKMLNEAEAEEEVFVDDVYELKD